MPSNEQNVQVCDATDDDSSTKAGPTLRDLRSQTYRLCSGLLHRIHIRHHRHTTETFVLMQDGHLFQ